jgi:hypothetical protein
MAKPVAWYHDSMLSIGIQEFEKLRRGGYIYVDKTQYLGSLLKGGYYFLSRPRRFGKSLLVSTLKAIFEGKQELFKGLWLENHDFKPRPVIHLDFSRLDFKEQSLSTALLKSFRSTAQGYGLELVAETPKDAFAELVAFLAKTEQVVVLVDEYDKPITDYLDEPERRRENQNTLKGVYGLLKPMDASLHLVFLTGVSKFGKLSLFSDLNNLLDISLDPEFALLLGYTREEIEANFASYIENAATRLKLSQQALWESLQLWYNGYSWDGENKVYCPYSMLTFLKKPAFKGYWYETGTPTFLLKLIKEQGIEPFYLEGLEAPDPILSVADVENLNPISIMFQTGYLTIQHIEHSPIGTAYTLSYPNEEVRQAFSTGLLGEYLQNWFEAETLGLKLRRMLAKLDWETFFQTVNRTLAGVPYQIFPEEESYFHSLVHLMLVSTGYRVSSEVSTHKGRMDTLVETLDRVIIFEFKLGGTTREALEQIQSRGYDRPFSKPVTHVGVVFDAEQKQVGAWEVAASQ